MDMGVSTPEEMTMNYEAGLNRLKQLAEGSDWYMEFTVYEARLRENLKEERLFGTNPQNTANRGPIVAQLNTLAYQHLHKTFNDLCMEPSAIPSAPQQPKSTKRPGQQKAGSHTQKAEIFISFHPSDQSYLEDLQRHLNQYVKVGAVSYWDRTKLTPGSQTDAVVKQAIQKANVAILILSADYLGTDKYGIRELSMILAAAQHTETRIFSIIARHCAFAQSELAQIEAVNDPEQPLSSMKVSQREELFEQLARSLAEVRQ
jgi:hypothetical protein